MFKLFQLVLNMSRIFLLFAILFLGFFNFSNAAINSNYLVENVAVSVLGKSPADARNLAVSTAQRDAFLILLTRLEISTNIADNINNEEISDMVMSQQIDGEKIAGNNYSGNFKITFAKSFVDHILAKKNLPQTVQKNSDNYLLIPVKIVNRQPILWEQNNDWKRAIENNLNKDRASKFITPEADIESISTINRDNISSANFNDLEPLLSKYNALAAYTMFFSYDEIENKANINVLYIRKLQKKQFRLSFVNVDHLAYEELVNKVAKKTIEYLVNSQNPETKDDFANLIRIKIPIKNLSDWLMTKNKIENSGLISQLNIESISRDYALISVIYNNSEQEISEAFLAINLLMEQKSENFYIITNN